MFNGSVRAFFLLAGLVAVVAPVQAQIYVPHTTTHIDLVPHTTTHFDQVRHGNHYHSVPHTTTHLDAVPHTTTHYDALPYLPLSSGYGGHYQSSRVIIPAPHTAHRPFYSSAVPHTTTHLDIVRHGRHYHVVPHRTSHYHH